MKDNIKIKGKRDPKHVVIAVAAPPMDRAALLAAIDAAKTVRELAAVVRKMLERWT